MNNIIKKIKMWWMMNRGKVIVQKELYKVGLGDECVVVRVALALNGIHFGVATIARTNWDRNVFRLLGDEVIYSERLVERIREQENE